VLRDALDAGADDVMRIPFEPEVLAMRVAAGLRAARLRAGEALLRSLVDNIPAPSIAARAISTGRWSGLSDEIEGITGIPPATSSTAACGRSRASSIPTTTSTSRDRSWSPWHGTAVLARVPAPARDGACAGVLERGHAQDGGRRPALARRRDLRRMTARRAAEQALREHEVIEAQLAEVRASRTRILDAADARRRDIERNLHDGAQQRLLAVALGLQRVARDAPRAARRHARAALRGAHELRDSLSELRDLARGLHPAVLSDHGLAHALRALGPARRRARRARHRSSRGATAMAIEAAAYFAVSEALTNVAKYAQASEATVTVEARDGYLDVSVDDDGVGGRTPVPARGCRDCATGSPRSTERSRSRAIRAPARSCTRDCPRGSCAAQRDAVAGRSRRTRLIAAAGGDHDLTPLRAGV
jgi:signal transduction histidine kinase